MKKNHLRYLCCLLLTAAFLSGCQDDASEYYEAGAAALESGDYQTAADQFTAGIEEKSRLAENWRGLGIAWYEQGKYEQAEQAFGYALDSMSKTDEAFSRDVMLYRAKNLECMGDTESAMTVYDQLLENNPEDSEIYFLRAKSSLEQGDTDAAKEGFSKAIGYAGTYSMCLSVYQLYEERSLKADGAEFLEQALNYTPQTAEDYYQLGCIDYELQKNTEAAEALSKSVEMGNEEAVSMLGNMYLELGDTASARDTFNQCLEKKKFLAAAYNGLAVCDMQDGDYDSALNNIAQGLNCGDESCREDLLYNEAVIYEKKGDFATANQKMQALLAEYPDCEEAIREETFLNR